MKIQYFKDFKTDCKLLRDLYINCNKPNVTAILKNDFNNINDIIKFLNCELKQQSQHKCMICDYYTFIRLKNYKLNVEHIIIDTLLNTNNDIVFCIALCEINNSMFTNGKKYKLSISEI